MNDIEKIIKIVESMMLMEGLMITKKDKENIRECLSNGDVEDKIKKKVEEYSLELVFKDNKKEKIQGQDIDYHYLSSGEIKKIMKQNNWLWVEDSTEMYEEDTELYHRTLTFEKERFIDNG